MDKKIDDTEAKDIAERKEQEKEKAIVLLPQAEIEKKEKAHMIYVEICQRKTEVAMNLIELGRLFKAYRDNKYYLAQDYETFECFLGSIGFNYKTVASFIHIHELYVEELKINKKFLALIGHANLQLINPVVKDNPEEWLFKARELSKSDLRNEVRVAQNKPEKEYPVTKGKPQIFDFKNYLEYIKAYGCITCDAKKGIEGAHFPKTDKAGAPDHWRIPLCKKCHDLYHHDPIDFLINYRNQVFEFFYNTFMTCYKLLKEK